MGRRTAAPPAAPPSTTSDRRARLARRPTNMLVCIASAASWTRSPPVGATTWRRRVDRRRMADPPLRAPAISSTNPRSARLRRPGRRARAGGRPPGPGWAAAASASVSPTRPDLGGGERRPGTLVGSKRNARTFASLDSALEAAIQPIRPAAWVNCRPPVTSPTAQMPSTASPSCRRRRPLPADRPRRRSPRARSRDPPVDRPTATRSSGRADGVASSMCTQALTVAQPLHPVHLGADTDVDAVGGQRLGDHRRRRPVPRGQEPIDRLDERDAAAEPGEGLGHLATIGPPPSTIIDSGRARRSNRFSLVSWATLLAGPGSEALTVALRSPRRTAVDHGSSARPPPRWSGEVNRATRRRRRSPRRRARRDPRSPRSARRPGGPAPSPRRTRTGAGSGRAASWTAHIR